MSQLVALDLGQGDVHTPAAIGESRKREMAEISGEARKALPNSKFALPSARKLPVHDASHTRNAAARLAQMKKAGKISDADYATAKKNIARAAKRFGIDSEMNASDAPPAPKRKSIHVRADLAPGGSLHVRHMREFYDGERVLLADDAKAADKPVWIQLARSGSFAGHPSGPFELNAQVFSEIVRNFEATKNRAIPIDFEHASEADPTSGSIPTAGAPAQGWIRELKIEGGNLFGLVEWGDLARQYIREGKYEGISPAIRFGARDRVTGKPIGAKLTSAGLTNQPFLDGMQRLAAKDSPAAATLSAHPGGLRSMAHAPGEYMPRLRAALSLHPMATARECADMLDTLRDHVSAAGDAMGEHEGVSLGQYTSALRELTGAVPGQTWEQVFDVVQDLIDAAIDQHVIEDHGGDADGDEDTMTYADDDGDEDEEMTMADDKTALAMRDAEAKNGELALQLKDANAKVMALEAELKSLRDWKAGREEADVQADVEIAFATYKDAKGLSDKDKPHMLSMAKGSPEAFRGMFPPVPAEQRHLLRNATPPAGRPTVDDVQSPDALSFTGLTKKLMADRKLSFSDAQDEAARLIQAARR